MTPYIWRLCCLSLAVLFVVQLCVGLLLRLASPRLVRLAEGLQPAQASGLMILLRWLPAVCGLFVALCLCVPAYLQLEPLVGQEEEIGAACAGLALGALLSYLIRAGHAASGVLRSEIHLRRLMRDAEERAGLCVIRETSPAMALAGLFHSRVVVSREVLELLTPDQMDVAQRHEWAHQQAHDNWKRLVMEVAPVDLSGGDLRAAWARFAEWSADDEAAAGDSARSVALASALVSVARLGTPECLLPQASMLVSDGRELRVRVERLLEPPGPIRSHFSTVKVAGVAIGIASVLVMIARQPACAEAVHHLLEALVD